MTESNSITYASGFSGSDLVASECQVCGDLRFPPRPVCSSCGADGTLARVLSMVGSVVAGTVVRVAPAGIGVDPPYGVALVHLDDGPNVVAQAMEPSASGLLYDAGTRVQLALLERPTGTAVGMRPV